MRLLAEVCGVAVVLPDDGGAAVVLGAAMLGRLAHDLTVARHQGTFVGKEEQSGRLWHIMVCGLPLVRSIFHFGFMVGGDDTTWNDYPATGVHQREENSGSKV